MSDCRVITVRLGRYFDWELSPAERRLVKDHIEQCIRCSAELEQIRQIAGAFQEGMPAPPVPSGLAQRIIEIAHERVGGNRSEWTFPLFWRNWSLSMRFAAVGVAAAACYIGIVVGSGSLPSAQRSTAEMQWIGMASQGPIVKAYMGTER